MHDPNSDAPLVSVVMPCLNEEEALPDCIATIQRTFSEGSINGEIIVSDNGSTDRSVSIAESLGVHVVHQPLRGYGNAYLKGFAAARGTYLIMGDADNTYDFSLIPHFLSRLQEGFDFVTGTRYAEGGAEHINFLHRYIGNPILTLILNVLFHARYTDVYCGYRAFSRKAYDIIQPISQGMEFNLELAINAHLAGLKVAEIPIKLGPRKGASKLNTFKDGWRSLRMMLLYCPNSTFLVPGLVFLLGGMSLHVLVLLRALQYNGRALGVITAIFGTIFSVIGFQILSLGLHAKTYSWSRRFDKDNETLAKFYNTFKLETGLLSGFALIVSGCAIIAVLVWQWLRSNLLPLLHPEWVPFAATLIIVGINVIFSSLFISAMSLSRTDAGRQ